MFSLSSWLHLRIPFSFFLLPIFLFTLCVSPNFNGPQILWVFLIVHLLLYPASNGYNSYFDKDEKSIGGLRNPPPTKKGLYYLSILLDLAAVVLGYWKINLTFAIMLLIYGLVSKAYSHPAIRLKKYAFISLIITGLFQGFFTVLMCYVGLNKYGIENALQLKVIVPGILASFMLWANYPMTQIYQHEEDGKRGDITASIKFGIRGTFYFAAIMFAFAVLGFILYFEQTFGLRFVWVFMLSTTPILIYFLYWLGLVIKNPLKADYQHTMWLNYISGTCLNIFFVYLFIQTSHVMQL
jgi:4-hydroxybenzoate polyprenyltransferase